jgi:hypothetical protein
MNSDFWSNLRRILIEPSTNSNWNFDEFWLKLRRILTGDSTNSDRTFDLKRQVETRIVSVFNRYELRVTFGIQISLLYFTPNLLFSLADECKSWFCSNQNNCEIQRSGTQSPSFPFNLTLNDDFVFIEYRLSLFMNNKTLFLFRFQILFSLFYLPFTNKSFQLQIINAFFSSSVFSSQPFHECLFRATPMKL